VTVLVTDFECSNECVGAPSYASDNFCDDGGPGSEYSDCQLGTDCADCGRRAISLVIEQGAQLVAAGTVAAPITFTSVQVEDGGGDGAWSSGLWAGIALHGAAPAANRVTLGCD